ncbi:MAG TPA: GNAT family N-acetyltransferase, partial [Bacteroidales bacterium]|nr:GNAT family N-acetyltransferase [Bacteroidales bacterium]
TIRIENYQEGQEVEIHQLIKNVYDEFVSIDYSDEGNKHFYDWIDPSRIAKRQKEQINLLVALLNSKIIGMIEIRDNKNISLLFVNKQYQGQGIAKRLFHESLKFCIQRDSTLDTFYVHASPFSIPIYKKMGFNETDSLQENHGIKYLPMELKINKLTSTLHKLLD